MSEVIKVGMADLNICKAPDVITTLGLGSCIGLTFYDPVSKVGGMVHYMLPDSTKVRNNGNIAKFADTGIEELNLEEQTSLLDVCADNTPSLQKVYLPSESNIRTFETDGSSIGCEKDSGGFVIGCSLK